MSHAAHVVAFQTLAERKSEQVDLRSVGYPNFSPEEARGWARACNETPQRWSYGWERCLRERWNELNRTPFPYSTGRVAKAVMAHMEEK